MPTPKFTHNACTALLTIALLSAGCDRNKVAPEDTTTATPLEQPSVLPAKKSLHGGVVPGSLSPQDLGPEAPALYFVTGLKGYTEPCGCTADILLGGIDRVTQYVIDAKALHPGALMIDTGDMLFEHAKLDAHLEPQERAKADVLTAAHRAMGTAFTVPGERDFALGTAFYLEKMAQATLPIVAANLTIEGQGFEATHVAKLGELKLGLIGAVDPMHFEGIEGVATTPHAPAIERALATLKAAGVGATVLVFHGELGPAKALLEQFPALDFVIVGHGPRETDQVDQAGQGFTLEAYDQGRYMGVLKLYAKDGKRPFVNARAGGKTELETIDRQIAHVQESIARLPAAEGGSESPLAARLRERLGELEARKSAIDGAAIELPEEASAFLYRPVPMEPGYGLEPQVKAAREQFNRSLQELSTQIERDPLPIIEGQPFFVGTQQCQMCHSAAHDFWQTTHHSKAVATLEARDKAFDQNCIGCHVVGWEQPGGSVLNKLEYNFEINGTTVVKDLKNVGCESCHGPGSEHRMAPINAQGTPQHIVRKPGVEQCTSCHVPEHSPTFDFDSYVKRITGDGHRLRVD
ncbi:MAG: hypothetical protein H0U74_15205 [Bradymonadaceae bacterium]|nr:hypothetical protein [Lujinxingiaceae bacterium]